MIDIQGSNLLDRLSRTRSTAIFGAMNCGKVLIVGLILVSHVYHVDGRSIENQTQLSEVTDSAPSPVTQTPAQTGNPVGHGLTAESPLTDIQESWSSPLHRPTVSYSIPDFGVLIGETGTSMLKGSEYNWTSDVGSSVMTSAKSGPLGSILTTPVSAVEWKWRSVTWNWFYSLEMASSITGIIGNLLVILVLWRRRAVNRSTDTLIGGLAVADFFTSILIIPVPAASVVPSNLLGLLYCKFVYTFYFMWCSIGASIYTLALLAIERLIAVKYPIYFNRIFSRKHASYVILIVWFCIMVLDLYPVIPSTVDSVAHVCVVQFRSRFAFYAVGMLIFFTYFVIPATTMVAAQALTAYTLNQKSRNFPGKGATTEQPKRNDKLLVAKNRVLRLLFVIITIFIICWGPNSIFYFLYNFGWIDSGLLYSPLNHAVVILGFCNSCLNPIVYTIRHPQFREAIRELFTGSKPREGLLFSYKSEKSVPDDIRE